MEGTGCQGPDKGSARLVTTRTRESGSTADSPRVRALPKGMPAVCDCCLSVRFWETVPLARTTAIRRIAAIGNADNEGLGRVMIAGSVEVWFQDGISTLQ